MLYTLEIKLDTGEQYMWEALTMVVALRLVNDFGIRVTECFITQGA